MGAVLPVPVLLSALELGLFPASGLALVPELELGLPPVVVLALLPALRVGLLPAVVLALVPAIALDKRGLMVCPARARGRGRTIYARLRDHGPGAIAV